MPAGPRAKHVFINCPFDKAYQPIFQAIVFAIYDLGFVARCALEVENSAQNRMQKILDIIRECRFGVHDISEVALSSGSNLPRFNMPLELGLYLGCKEFGGRDHNKKGCLILEEERYRYQKFISDIAGQDIQAHGRSPKEAIKRVRNWLSAESKEPLSGGAEVAKRYGRFRKELPTLCKAAKLDVKELTYADLSALIVEWLRTSG